MRRAADKPYRLFPELDRFSDSACELLLSRLRASRRHNVTVLAAVSGTALVVFACGVAILWMVQDTWLAFEREVAEEYGRSAADIIGVGLAFAPTLLATGLASLFARDVVGRVALRRALGRRIREARCTGCGQILLGCSVSGNMVQCPDCGRVVGLRELKLEAPADLLSSPLGLQPGHGRDAEVMTTASPAAARGSSPGSQPAM
jgi:hypothetical protein